MAPADESDVVRAPLPHSARTGDPVRPKQKAFGAFAGIYNAAITIQATISSILKLNHFAAKMKYILGMFHLLLNSVIPFQTLCFSSIPATSTLCPINPQKL
ncbi:MAG: hypothetical protein PHO08_17900 [Methylococcales bacterium]|nr:hypothetical protein [Methylococcales bacterium]